jgi:hypothetical protein
MQVVDIWTLAGATQVRDLEARWSGDEEAAFGRRLIAAAARCCTSEISR